MKKRRIKQHPKENGLVQQTGKIIGSVGTHIVNARNNVADFVTNQVDHAKKTASKIGKEIREAAKEYTAGYKFEKNTKKVMKNASKAAVKKLEKKPLKKRPALSPLKRG